MPKQSHNLGPRLEKFTNQQGYSLLSGQEAKKQMNGIVQTFTVTMKTLSAASALIIAFGLANIILVNALGRIRLLGIVKGLGMKRRQLIRTLAMENLFIGLICLPPGLLAGYFIGQGLMKFIKINMDMTLKFSIAPINYFLTIFLILAILYLTAIFPARRIAKIKIADALRYE